MERKINIVKPIITNPARYWAGVGMMGIEILILLAFIMTLIDWSWITTPMVLTGGCILAFMLYNGIAYLFMWSGSEKK